MKEKATFAGGCFWCTEAVFQRIRGIESVIPGYTGGFIKNPPYREVCSGRTGHAEAVQITFDTDKTDFKTLLAVFFATHDPTTLNRQGNDVGSQYRSGVFYHSDYQRTATKNYIIELEEKKVFTKPIVTEVVPFDIFYIAEVEHHEYYSLNKDQPYCQYVIAPKLEKLTLGFEDKLNSEQ